MSNLAVDIDGCLANFTTRYVDRIIQVTGVDKFEGDQTAKGFPPVWNYPEEYGYTSAQMDAVWKSIRKDELFWATLDPLPGAMEAVRRLERARMDGHDVYFITSRPGYKAKFQTECWLRDMGMDCPTVIIADVKVDYLSLLKLDVFVEDRLDAANALMGYVRLNRLGTRVYLVDAPYNRRPVADLTGEQFRIVGDELRDPALKVVADVGVALDAEGL